jgi:hypothetical protein
MISNDTEKNTAINIRIIYLREPHVSVSICSNFKHAMHFSGYENIKV